MPCICVSVVMDLQPENFKTRERMICYLCISLSSFLLFVSKLSGDGLSFCLQGENGLGIDQEILLWCLSECVENCQKKLFLSGNFQEEG